MNGSLLALQHLTLEQCLREEAERWKWWKITRGHICTKNAGHTGWKTISDHRRIAGFIYLYLLLGEANLYYSSKGSQNQGIQIIHYCDCTFSCSSNLRHQLICKETQKGTNKIQKDINNVSNREAELDLNTWRHDRRHNNETKYKH